MKEGHEPEMTEPVGAAAIILAIASHGAKLQHFNLTAATDRAASISLSPPVVRSGEISHPRVGRRLKKQGLRPETQGNNQNPIQGAAGFTARASVKMLMREDC